MTPEGKVKAEVKKLIQPLRDLGELYSFMPVPYGYGESSLDFIGCHRGEFFAIETKAPGGELTPRQEVTKEKIERAGGRVFVIDGPVGLKALELWLQRT